MLLSIDTIVAMLGYVQWLMDYLIFIVRELLLVAKDLRQKHYESNSQSVTRLINRGTRYSHDGVNDFHYCCAYVPPSRHPRFN
jgi:hypothetical protein